MSPPLARNTLSHKAAGYLESDVVLEKPQYWRLSSERQRRRLITVLFLVGMSSYADRTVIAVLLEPIKQEFHVSDTELGLLTGLSFALLYAIAGIPIARLLDRYNRASVIAVCIAIWSVMTAACGFASTFWQLALARFCTGAGEAGAVPGAHSLIADYYPPARRGRAIGIFTMCSSAGYALGLIAGGFIAQSWGWRAVFVCFGASGLIVVVIARLFIFEPRTTAQHRGAPRHAESALRAIQELLGKKSYRLITAATVIYFFMSYGALVFVVPLFIRAHGMSIAMAGTVFGIVFASGAVVGSLVGGAIGDRWASSDKAGYARLAAVTMIGAVPLFEVAFWVARVDVMTVCLFLATCILTASSPAAFSCVQAVCGASRRAVAVALMFLFSNLLGLGLGPLITGSLSDHYGASYGSGEGLRIALMLVMTALVPGAWVMHRAARYVPGEVEE